MPGTRDQLASGGSSPTVRVFGRASIRTEPDEALVWLTLTALDASAAAALSDISERSDELASLLDRLGVGRADRTTTGITVREEFEGHGGETHSVGHRASVTTVIRLANPERIGQAITRAITDLDARVQGPSWSVSQENPAWMQAARLAAAHAREKARAYAAGVDARLGRLLELSEPIDQRWSPAPQRMAVAATADIRIEGGEQEVSACVWAEFELEASA